MARPCSHDATGLTWLSSGSSRSEGIPFTCFGDPHTAVGLTAHRDPIQPRSRVQARSESVTAPLVRANAPNIEVLTDFHSVDALGELAIRAGLFDSRTEVCVLKSDAVSIAAGGIDNLTFRNGTVGVNPIAPTPTVCSRKIGDLFAVAMSSCW